MIITQNHNQPEGLPVKSYLLQTILVCGALAALKILFLYHVDVNLWVDEAQYWAWSKAMDYGYYSKPPFIAWLIHFTTGLFSDSEFGIRVGAISLHFLTSIFVFLIARNLYDNKTAYYSALTYLTLPGVVISSTFISTDAPLIFFWAASLYFLLSATKFSQKYQASVWLMYAVCLGLGLLSKYTIAVFVFMSFYYFFTENKGRNIFKPGFWIANILAFLIFVPNLYWNYKNNFVSFRHTEENVVTGTSGGGLKILEMLEFSASQFAVFGLALFFFAIIVFKKETDARLKYNKKLLLIFSLPLLAVAVLISLKSGAQAHWAAPAYIGATILTINYIIRYNKVKWLKIILISNAIIFAACLNIKIPASIASVKKDPLARVNSWYILAAPLEASLKLNSEAIIVSDERKIIAPLMFAMRDENGNPKIIYKWNPSAAVRDHYDLTQSFVDDGTEKPLLFVTRNSDAVKPFSDKYLNIDALLEPADGNKFYIYLIKGHRDKLEKPLVVKPIAKKATTKKTIKKSKRKAK